MLDSGIYQILNIKNNKMYIGQTRHLSKRYQQHLEALRQNVHFNKLLQNAFNHYGCNCFQYNILERCNVENLTERENYWIQHFGGINSGNVYNLQCGLEPAHFTQDIRNKISSSNKGKHSKTDNGMYGKHHTKESKELISKHRKGTPAWNKGKHWSDEIKQKIKIANRTSPNSGKHKVSEEFKQKLHNLYYGKDRLYLRKESLDIVNQLREEYIQLRSFKLVAQLHPDMYYEKVRCLIKYGTITQTKKQTNRDTDWTKTIQ